MVQIPEPNPESLLTGNGQSAVVGRQGDERSGISLDGNLVRECADFLQLWKVEPPDGGTGQDHPPPAIRRKHRFHVKVARPAGGTRGGQRNGTGPGPGGSVPQDQLMVFLVKSLASGRGGAVASQQPLPIGRK